MIIEGLVTTTNADGSPHLAPMGPTVEGDCQRLALRPFQTSTTFANLHRSGVGVFHVTDDVELLAHAAIGRLDCLPPLERAMAIDGWIVADACRWYEFRVEQSDLTAERALFVAEVVQSGVIREFSGFNRGKHAVIEAAILATRVHLISQTELRDQMARLKPLVDKTGGPSEQRAFDLLSDYIRSAQVGAVEPREVDHSVSGR